MNRLNDSSPRPRFIVTSIYFAPSMLLCTETQRCWMNSRIWKSLVILKFSYNFDWLRDYNNLSLKNAEVVIKLKWTFNDLTEYALTGAFFHRGTGCDYGPTFHKWLSNSPSVAIRQTIFDNRTSPRGLLLLNGYHTLFWLWGVFDIFFSQELLWKQTPLCSTLKKFFIWLTTENILSDCNRNYLWDVNFVCRDTVLTQS